DRRCHAFPSLATTDSGPEPAGRHARTTVTGDTGREAGSRTTDADIAQETASHTRYTILQRNGAAVLAQANQQPAMTLQLLRRGKRSGESCGVAGEISKVEMPSEAEMGAAETQPIEE